MSTFLTALADLTRRDTRQRDLAAETLSDLLRTGALAHSDAQAAVTALVALAGNDPDATVQESALHAITEAFDHYELPLRLFRPLQQQMPTMPPILLAEYALYILAATHDPDARPTIETFLAHPDPAVHRAAREAIAELPGQSSE
jgi:HEAT repeat protein